MSTIHNINGDLAAASATIKPLDMIPVFIAADGVSKKMSGAQIKSQQVVAAGSTLTLTAAAHGGATILLDTAAGSTVTLPAASGSGVRFRFVVSVLATSNSHIVKVANSSDTMIGIAFGTRVDTGNAVLGFAAAASSDTITLNRTTTGSVSLGEWIEVVDEATNKWSVSAFLSATGAAFATPFSATV